jgi:PKD repeat protein
MKKVLIFFVVVALLITLVEAADFSVNKNNSFIEKEYFAGDVVRGVLNISFDEQQNAYFSSNLGSDKMRVLDVLEDMSYVNGGAFSCEPLDCGSFYQAYDSESEKTITMGDEKEIYGFKIQKNGLVTSVQNFSFVVDVYADKDCENQIFIDIFDDGIIDFYNQNYSLGDDCSDYFSDEIDDLGCFDSDETSDVAPIGRDYYCELMKDIPPAAGYEIGANLVMDESGGALNFAIFPADGGCDALARTSSTNLEEGGEVGGFVGYSVADPFDALVCIRSDIEHEDYYSIAMEEDGDTCGTVFESCDDVSEGNLDADYDIYIKPQAYDSIGQVTFNAATYEAITGRDLMDDLEDYLNRTYGNNCSGDDGCVIPFSMWGKDSAEGYAQKIYSAELKYRASSSSGIEKKIFEVRKNLPKISSNFLKIDLSKLGFEVPDTSSKQTIRLYLDGNELIKEIVHISTGFVFDISPHFAFIGRTTSFSASTNLTIASSVWDFGDGSQKEIVQGKSATHAYSQEGEYVVTTTLIRPLLTQNSTRRFKVIVGDAYKSADILLKDYESRLSNVQSNINQYPEWMRESISQAVGIDAKKTVIQSKRGEFNSLGMNAKNESYIGVVNGLLSIDMPYSVFTKSSGSLPGIIGLGNIMVSPIEEISGTTATDQEDLKARIIQWMDENYDLTISFETLAIKGDEEDKNVLNRYKILISKKAGANPEPAFLIINHPKSDMVFASQGSDFLETSVSGAAYLNLDSTAPSNVEFLIAGDAPSVMDLGVYISPELGVLGANSKEIVNCWSNNCDEGGNFLWGRFIIGMSILIILFFAVYIILQTWYKRNYEKHLFPNPNDLYNVLNFIYNSRRNGLRDSEIKDSLEKRKWDKEQVGYAFKKLAGKRTGMWEIPLFKFVENRKVRTELQKKQGGRPIDTRFIKRSNL